MNRQGTDPTNIDTNSTTEWQGDSQLFSLIQEELYTAVIGDICDQFGLRRQFLAPNIRSLHLHSEKHRILVGRAMTVLEVRVSSELPSVGPFGKMLEALDNIREGEVYVCAGSDPSFATIGELMCTAMLKRGAAGAVTDGAVRDTTGILSLDFPVFCTGSYGQDQRGRGIVLDYRVPIEINGVVVNDGDLIVGDVDGVIAIPSSMERQVIGLSLNKARGEKTVKKAILEGLSASEAFERYGIL